MTIFSLETSSESGVKYSEHMQAEKPGFQLPQIGDFLEAFENLSEVTQNTTVSWDTTLCKLLHIHQGFIHMCCLSHQARL
jgi:hypothetical protein